jgi:hypothetical protein
MKVRAGGSGESFWCSFRRNRASRSVIMPSMETETILIELQPGRPHPVSGEWHGVDVTAFPFFSWRKDSGSTSTIRISTSISLAE